MQSFVKYLSTYIIKGRPRFPISIQLGTKSSLFGTSMRLPLDQWTTKSIIQQRAHQTKSMDILVTHYKCRNSVYQRSDVVRQSVPDEKVSWNQEWEAYCPPFYISTAAKHKPWADPDVAPLLNEGESKLITWNSLDGKVDRRSHLGPYKVVDGLPRNPIGRTGLAGRGFLGRWGPNHAADPIVTRWKNCAKAGEERKLIFNDETHLPILQFVGIQRGDTKEWAIPGGMIDPGEIVSKTLQREFEEEALNALDMTNDERANLQRELQAFFSSGRLIYNGYIDDPRNTDNSWIETVAMNFHDELGESVGSLQLHAGDDAVQVKWMDVSHKMILYANHGSLLEKVASFLKAHW